MIIEEPISNLPTPYFKINKTSSNSFKTKISKFKTINKLTSKIEVKSHKHLV
jgi:hypothetical protein